MSPQRNGGDRREPHGINEVCLCRGEIVREGMHTTLSDLRSRALISPVRLREQLTAGQVQATSLTR